MSDDYSIRQAERDREYETVYNSPEVREWIESLDPKERERLEAEGLLKPLIQRSGTGMRDEDLADSPLASEELDIATEIDGPEISDAPLTENSDEKVLDMLRRLIAEVLSQNNARLTLECLALACGLTALQGESMTGVAKRHGVSRAAVSKRCVDITEKLNLPPSRSMRSKKARKAYRRAQIRIRTRNE